MYCIFLFLLFSPIFSFNETIQFLIVSHSTFSRFIVLISGSALGEIVISSSSADDITIVSGSIAVRDSVIKNLRPQSSELSPELTSTAAEGVVDDDTGTVRDSVIENLHTQSSELSPELTSTGAEGVVDDDTGTVRDSVIENLRTQSSSELSPELTSTGADSNSPSKLSPQPADDNELSTYMLKTSEADIVR